MSLEKMFSLLTLNLLITSPQLKSLCYKPEGRGFDSWWCHWNFSST